MKPNIFLSLIGVLILGCNPQQTAATRPNTASPIAVSSPTDSPIANASATQGTDVLRSGTFVHGEHSTNGTVSIVNKDGKRFLELDEAFETSTSGPDLFVILHRSTDVIGSTKPPAYAINEGDYIVLEPLKAYSGAQSYEIPADINLDDFQSAAIWCRQFNATFGAARLQ